VNNSFFSSRVDEIMMQLMVQMFERLGQLKTTGQGTAAETTDSQAGGGVASTGASAQKASSTAQAAKTSAVTGDFASMIKEAAAKYGVNPALVQAVIKAESNFNPKAVSSCGALGLMQLMPATARGLGVSDPLDPEQNIDGGTKFLSGLLKRYNGDVKLAVAAYNAGPGAVDRYNGIPPYRETQVYVQRVLGYYQSTIDRSG
jgi:soluble lytic murein transglycosylase-like protein